LKESDLSAGASRTDSLHPHDFMNVEDYYFEGGPEISLPGGNIFKIELSYRKRDFLSFSSGDFGNFTGDSEMKTVTVSPQVLLKNSAGKAKNTLTLGFDYTKTKNEIVNESLFFGEFSMGLFDLEKENYGYYLHDEIAIADSLDLSGGYRHDRAEFTFDPSTPGRVDMQKDLYTAGINYNFREKSYVYFSYSRSYRYPLLDELYSFFTNTVNTSLKPQTSDDYEFGIRYYFTNVAYAHVNFFRIDTDEEIFFNPDTYTNENLDGSTRREGIEISLSARPIEWLTLKAGYTYTVAEIRNGLFKGNDVPNVPQNQAVFVLETSPGKGFTVTLNGSYIGERPFVSDFANTFGEQESYVLLNSRIQYQWKSLKAFVNINNITDEEYSEYGVLGGFPVEKAFYPTPKINFLAGLSLEL
jgi:iron complex outermembrane receptor protein